MRKLGSWLVPYLIGLLIMVEGAVLLVLAREIELVDVLVLDQMMTMVLGAAFLVLGLLLFLPIIPQLRKLSEPLMKRMQVTAAMVVMVVSLMFALLAAPAVFEDYGNISKYWVVLAASQLFLLGMLSFIFVNYAPLADRRMAWLECLGMFGASLVITEGVVILGLRGDLNIHGVMETGPALMSIVGVALVALGIIELVIFNRRQEGQSEQALLVLDWAAIGASIAIGVLGLLMLNVTTSMTLDGVVYSYYWLLTAGLLAALMAPLLDYTQTVVAGREGWNTDLGLITAIVLLIAIPLAAGL